MDVQARPEDVLLAYKEDFTGYSSLSDMAFPLESSGALGGGATTADPDGYYEDFTAHLDRYVRGLPPPDWKILVLGPEGSEPPKAPQKGPAARRGTGLAKYVTPVAARPAGLTKYVVPTPAGTSLSSLPAHRPAGLTKYAVPAPVEASISSRPAGRPSARTSAANLAEFIVPTGRPARTTHAEARWPSIRLGGEMDETEAEELPYEVVAIQPLARGHAAELLETSGAD
jgi:hypothetical protein